LKREEDKMGEELTDKLEKKFLNFIEDNAHRGTFAQSLEGYIRQGYKLPDDTEECRALLNKGIDLYLVKIGGYE